MFASAERTTHSYKRNPRICVQSYESRKLTLPQKLLIYSRRDSVYAVPKMRLLCHLPWPIIKRLLRDSPGNTWQKCVGWNINQLIGRKNENRFKSIILGTSLMLNGKNIATKSEFACAPQVLTSIYDKSTFEPVMARCHQTRSHYLHQCWPRSLMP